MSTIRCILAIAASSQWKIRQLDINNAILDGDLHEEVYMKIPKGMEYKPNQACLLKISLYGLKQAFRQWCIKLLDELKSLGYILSKNDYSLFLKRQHQKIVIVAVYVGDIIITC